jgi:hypothetical protein
MKDTQETQTTTEVETQQPAGQPAQQPVDLNINDLVLIRNIIDLASQRGAFKAAEMEAVGKMFNKLSSFLDAIAAKKEVE